MTRKDEIRSALAGLEIPGEQPSIEYMRAGAKLKRYAYFSGQVMPCWRTNGRVAQRCVDSGGPNTCYEVVITGATYAIHYGNFWGDVTNIATIFVWPECKRRSIRLALRRLLIEE